MTDLYTNKSGNEPETMQSESAHAGQNPFTGAMPVTKSPFTAPTPAMNSSSAPPVQSVHSLVSHSAHIPTISSRQDTSFSVTSKTSIIIYREAHSFLLDYGVDYAVFLDGIMIGDSKKGKTELPVSPGHHVIVLKRKALGKNQDQEQYFRKAEASQNKNILLRAIVLGSREISFSIAEGEHVVFRAKPVTSFWKLILKGLITGGNPALYYMLNDPDGWLILKKSQNE